MGLALLIRAAMMVWIMAAHFLLQIFQRFTQHIGHNANAGYHKQKVRHGFHLLSTEVLRNSVQPAATQWSAFHCRQTKLNHIYCCPSILFHAIIETTISKGKKFSYSFICGKGYSSPKGGRIAFVYSLRRAVRARYRPTERLTSLCWRSFLSSPQKILRTIHPGRRTSRRAYPSAEAERRQTPPCQSARAERRPL